MSITKTLGFELDTLETIMIEAGGIFIVAGILLVVFLYFSRLYKNHRRDRIAELKEELRHSLNVLLVHHDGGMPLPSYQFHLDELKRTIRESFFGKQAMIDYMVGLKNSLSGETAKHLDHLYRELGLNRYSEKKMYGRDWKLQAQGIRELSAMNNCSAQQLRELIIPDRNDTLQEEILMAIVRLDTTAPLSFLDNHRGRITGWMTLNLHHFIALLDRKYLPAFSQWFHHFNPDVVKFSIEMAQQFHQTEAIPELITLLSHQDAVIAAAAIAALKELNGHAALQTVVRTASRYWENDVHALAVVRYLGAIGVGPEQEELLESYMTHPSFRVRLEAVRQRLLIGPFPAEGQPDLQALVAHVQEPLLS